MLQEAFVDSQHQRVVFHVLSALVKLSSNLPENQRNLSHTFCGINSLFVSFNNTCTFHLERKKKKLSAFWGLSKDIPLNYIQPPAHLLKQTLFSVNAMGDSKEVAC